MILLRYVAALALLAGAATAHAEPRLSLPADCTLGDSCFIQQYPDTDPGPGAQDYMCQWLSYDGHKGTDFGLPSLAAMHAGVAVIAPAAGTVRRVRGGLPGAGLATAAPSYDAGKSGGAEPERLRRDAPALVAWGYGFGARAGDVIGLTITGPDGSILL
ncbi:MAG TPA: hypothetical protein VIN05_03020 [Roseovarius sp.]